MFLKNIDTGEIDKAILLWDGKSSVKAEGGVFDKFGMLVIPEGGHHIKVYLDDLKYTTASEPKK